MADSDKNIIITPNRGATSQPTIRFTGQGNDPITIRVLDGATGTGLTAGGALSFEGSAGQLFSVVNRLGTGSIFSVNDISGIPSIDIDANGTIQLAGFTGNVGIGLTAPAEKLHVIGNIRLSGGLSAASATFSNDIIVNGVRVGEGGGSISTNVAVGQSALNANTTGSQSVAIGTEAAATGVTVTNITAVGYRSLYLNRADNNTSVGSNSLQANTTGTQNLAVGTSVLFANTTGSFNVGIGHAALNSQTDSTENIGIGRLSLLNLTTGSQNTAIGSQTGRYFGSGITNATSCSTSTFIGYDARPLGNAETNQIVIGYQGRGDGSNTTVIGNSSTTSTRVFGLLSTNGGLSASGGLGITGGATFFGNINVNGNIVFPTVGRGLDFSATVNATGGTGTSEIFSDYEEGTWTPTITFGGNCAGQTYDIREGFYTKIGRLVTISAVTRFTNKGGSTGDCDLANLPFAVPVGQGVIPATVWFNNVTFANQLIARTSQSTTTCRFQEITEAGVNTNITNNDLGNNSHLAISVTFPTGS